mmetsp:Transcript_52166/g.130972  ORF Transcript_52166/g.130972 Transcript_52166/m.130972 type:complete len:110 (+) Transcript_52166:55-384(+)
MNTRYFVVFGRVQGVMFRQTLIRGAQKRSLQAGATNHADRIRVDFTLEGSSDVIDELVEKLQSTKPLNSWGAQVEKLEEAKAGIALEAHQVTTLNVDRFRWSKGVEMYL